MNEPITMTPLELWNIFMAICGAIVAISAAVAVIIKVINHFKAPDKKQDQRITDLENGMQDIKKRLDDGDRHFKEQDEHMKQMEASQKRWEKVMIESLRVLIEHGIDGNNIEGMKEQKKEIDAYLLER